MTLPFVEPVAARVAAVKSLHNKGNLQQLSVLGYKPSCNEELAAFVEVAQQLQKHKLQHAGICLQSACSVDIAGLMLVGKLSGSSQFQGFCPKCSCGG